jgi:hypothetical protein
MRFQFNIIYTPGTVKHLSFFCLESLKMVGLLLSLGVQWLPASGEALSAKPVPPR